MDSKIFRVGKRITVEEYLDGLIDDMDLSHLEGLKEEICEVVDEYKNYIEIKFSTTEILRAALYIVLKRRGIPRDARKMTEDNEKDKLIYQRWKKISREIGEPIRPFSSREWLPRIFDLFEDEYGEVSDDVKEETRNMLDKLLKKDDFGTTAGMNPKVLAGSVFLYALKRNGYNIGKRRMAEYIEVATRSIQLAYRKVKGEITN